MKLFDWLNAPVYQVAPRLLGCTVIRDIEGQELVGRIVEVEAYDQTDAASHSYKGKTPRTDVMFGPPGYWYVYFTYGMHYCANVVVGPPGHGAAVLIRALEPIKGQVTMSRLRGNPPTDQLTNGPAKFCQAFAIDKTQNGHDIAKSPLRIEPGKLVPENEIVTTTRVGISRARDMPWRFYLRDSPWVSRR